MHWRRINIFIAIVISVLFAPLLLRAEPDGNIVLSNLRCEMLHNPLGIDVKQPRLSWEIQTDQRNVQQTAYQVIVASSKEKLAANQGDLWNSGKIISDHSVNVIYNGQVLKSGTRCFWKIKIWTNKGESGWSKSAFWQMGLLKPGDWQAKWIGLDRAFPWDSAHTMFSRLSARYFRKTFTVSKTIKKATAYIVGLGYYQLYINGQHIGDQVLMPAPTDYTKSVLYNTYDVTNQLKQGANAIGAVLGNGLFFTMRQNYKTYKIKNFGYPKMLLQLAIQYNDGSKQIITSDGSWKVTADGPIRTNNIYDGEEYDARKEMPGWSTARFDDQNWLNAQLVKAPGGEIKAQMNEKIQVMDSVKPVAIHYLRPGVYIMDMGQNMAGWLRMKVNGDRGRKVTLRFAETLQANGELQTMNLRDAKATDVYTLKGGGTESWSPAFTYHGFRYVEITNYPGKPTVNSFMGEVVYDGLSNMGRFSTSDSTINQIYHNAFRGIRSNYKGVPVDCPQRNERMPWLADHATGCYGESFLFDNEKLYAQWLNDIQEAQTAKGVIPDVAPAYWHYYTDDVTWPGTYLLVAEMLYRQYGDIRPIRAHYASMQKWLLHIRQAYMRNGLITKDKYGDWCMPPEHMRLIHAIDPGRITDGTLIATAYYYHLLDLAKRFAVILNKADDVKEYATLMNEIKTAFNQKFLDNKNFQYSNNTVTANLLPLYFGMVPANARKVVFNHIVDKTEHTYNGHISTGVIGTQWLMRTLTNYGSADIAYQLATNTTYPSWGYMLDNGATTIWELWNGNKANQNMNSRNHVMLSGDLVIWFYEDLAGIKSDPRAPGFKRIIMRPANIDSLNEVKAAYHSIHGLIKSHWTKKHNQFSWQISIPANTTATVYIPAKAADEVMESGKNPTAEKDIKFLGMQNGRAVYAIGSGNYSFVAED